MKKALITGITGQDGSYLADLLLEKGYEVHGIIRRASTFNTSRIDHLYADPHVNGVRLFLHYGDLTDSVNLVKLLYELKPDEIYHLGGAEPCAGELRHSGIHRRRDRRRDHSDSGGDARDRNPSALLPGSTSEMFGKVQQVPQTEKTPFWPRSPYGVAKVFAYWATVNYRESYGFHASNGILFNHESPRRAKRLSPAKSHERSRRLRTACRRNSSSETWRPSATGVTPRSMWRACGACSSRMTATISCSRLTKLTRCANSAKSHLLALTSIGGIT